MPEFELDCLEDDAGMIVLRLMIVACVLSSGMALADTPRRIVSMNLCADQMVLQLAEPGTVLSVSFLTANPAESPMAHLTDGLVLNRGQAEEAIALDPDDNVDWRCRSHVRMGHLEMLDGFLAVFCSNQPLEPNSPQGLQQNVQHVLVVFNDKHIEAFVSKFLLLLQLSFLFLS